MLDIAGDPEPKEWKMAPDQVQLGSLRTSRLILGVQVLLSVLGCLTTLRPDMALAHRVLLGIYATLLALTVAVFAVAKRTHSPL